MWPRGFWKHPVPHKDMQCSGEFYGRGSPTYPSETKATHLRSLFKPFGDKLEVVLVEDITKEGAFDDVVKGVDVIAHTTSPFHLKADDPSELIAQGTTGILVSTLKNGSTVKCIVVTSSCAGASIAEVNEKGPEVTNHAKDRASKTLAEQAAWEFWNKHKGEVLWDPVVTNQPFVFGLLLHEADKPESLNQSARDWYETMVKGVLDNDALVNIGSSYVDVRELAQGRVLAVTQQEAGGERVVISAGPWKWQDFVNVAHRLYPSQPAGNPSDDSTTAVHLLLVVKFKTLKETAKDTLDDFQARGGCRARHTHSTALHKTDFNLVVAPALTDV
ncbi:NAD(P)-binding protein [Ganoderma leucocontextum]|nr:NAD(P)-binding protein [Ganoderma leucocontextum]